MYLYIVVCLHSLRDATALLRATSKRRKTFIFSVDQVIFQLHHPCRAINPAGCLTNCSLWKVCALTSAEMQIFEDGPPPPFPLCPLALLFLKLNMERL